MSIPAIRENQGIVRDHAGRFSPGHSGNLSGRPRLPVEFRELARGEALNALKRLIKIAEDPDTPL